MAIDATTIEGFVRTLLMKNFDAPVDIPHCHRQWWEACCSPNKFVALAAPRGHAKSTAITHSYLLAKVLFRESCFVLLVSDSEGQSSLFLNDIKKELSENEDLREFFRIAALTKDTETDMIVRFEDGHEAKILAKGSEQKLRGLKWAGKRPDLIICDDLENDELVLNKERRDKLKSWFLSALLPVRSKEGIIRMVGTILHQDSLLESLMPQVTTKGTIETPLLTYTTKPGTWLSYKYRAHSRDFKEILWKERHSEKDLRELQQWYKAQGKGDLYSREYLNEPIDESNTYFRRSDFRDLTRDEKDAKGRELIKYITMDLAVTEKSKADYSCLMTLGVDEDGMIEILDVIRERMDSLEIVDRLMALVKQHDPYLVVSEKGIIANSILPIIKKKMSEENTFFSFELIASTVDKIQRAQSIRARARAGKVKVDKSKDWWETLEAELVVFPRGKHDDQVDALALAGLAITKFHEARNPLEIEEEQEEEDRRIGGFNMTGRSAYTGY